VQIAISENGQIIAILQIAIYKNSQIIAILQIIKIPLYRDFLAIYKNGQIIYQKGQIIAIISNININGLYIRIYNHDPCLHIPVSSHIGTAGRH
jgi:hypothetical protein